MTHNVNLSCFGAEVRLFFPSSTEFNWELQQLTGAFVPLCLAHPRVHTGDRVLEVEYVAVKEVLRDDRFCLRRTPLVVLSCLSYAAFRVRHQATDRHTYVGLLVPRPRPSLIVNRWDHNSSFHCYWPQVCPL